MSEIEPEIGRAELFRVTAEIIAAHVANNAVPASDVARLIGSVHQALDLVANGAEAIRETPRAVEPEAVPGEYEPPIVPMALPAPEELADAPEPVPMVPINESVHPDHLVCLECGRDMKVLSRHVVVAHGLTFDAYRRKWRLPKKYPAVAAEYSAEAAERAKAPGGSAERMNEARRRNRANAAAAREPEAAPPPPPPPPEPEPAVAIADSVKPDKLFCLECGKPFKVLAMHLNQVHHLSPSIYRHKWGLPEDYPMMCAETVATYREAKVKGFGTVIRARKGAAALEDEQPPSIGEESTLLRAVGGGR